MIVDNNALFRHALHEFLSQEPDLQIAGEAGDTCEAIRLVGTLSPDLVLTDLSMPDAHGVEAVSRLKRHYPAIKILVVSFHAENEFKRGCRKAGAAGYVVKDAIYKELRDGIRAVLAGRTYMGAHASQELLVDSAPPPAAIGEPRSDFRRWPRPICPCSN